MTAEIQDVCDAIWSYETRTLRAGTPLVSPSTSLELICDAAWSYSNRTLISTKVVGGKRKNLLQRPDNFRINPFSSLAQGLVFAGLGYRGSDKTTHYRDSSYYGNHGTLTNMDPATNWVWSSELGRWCLDFDGGNDYIPKNATPLPMLTNISVSLWLNYGSVADYDGVIGTQTGFGGAGFSWYGENSPAGFAFTVEQMGIAYHALATFNSDTWVHLCGTFESDNKPRAYLNGALFATGPNAVTAPDPNNTTGLWLGSLYGAGSYTADITVTDPMVHTRVLSLSEIQQLADPSNVMLSGLILPPTRKFFPSAVAQPVSTLNIVGGKRRKLLERPDNFKFNSFSPLAQGLVFAGLGYKGSDKTTHYRDSSHYGNHGTLTNMDPPSDWVWSSELGRWINTFDGSDDYITVPHSSLLSIGQDATAAVTVSAWIRQGSTARSYETYIQKGIDTGSASVDLLLGSSGTSALWGTGISADSVAWMLASSTIIAGTWTHLCGTLLATGTTTGSKAFYVNGVIKGSGNYTNKAVANTTALEIARGGFIALADVADACIWRRILSPSEIQQLADPSNVMLSGMILPPTRKIFPVGITSSPSVMSVTRYFNQYINSGFFIPRHKRKTLIVS